MTPTILSFGLLMKALVERNRRLADAGFEVAAAASLREACELLGRNQYAAVVIGHGVPPRDRNELALCARRQQPQTKIIMLYNNSIDGAELAHAVLNVRTADQNLPETIRHLSSIAS